LIWFTKKEKQEKPTTSAEIMNAIIYILPTKNCEKLKKNKHKNNNYKNKITIVKDRLKHDCRKANHETKIETELDWKAAENFETGLKKTVNWYLKKYNF